MTKTTSKKTSGSVIGTADDVTDVVLAAMDGAPNARLREIASSFVRHMHAFAREQPGGFAFAHADRTGQADHKRLIAAHAAPVPARPAAPA